MCDKQIYYVILNTLKKDSLTCKSYSSDAWMLDQKVRCTWRYFAICCNEKQFILLYFRIHKEASERCFMYTDTKEKTQ